MADVSDVPQLIDKKGDNYTAVAPRLEPGKFKKWKKIISYEITKDTWIDLVYGFEGPFDSKKNRIMDLKLEYQMFRAKPSKTLSQTYTRYKTLLYDLANDGRLRNANHTQTLDLADIYESPSTSQPLKPFQSKNKGLVAETFDWDEEVYEEETKVQVLTALVDDELSVGKNHACHPLSELTKESHVHEVSAPNEHDNPHTEDVKGIPDLLNTERTQIQLQTELSNPQLTDDSSRNNFDVSVPITEPLVPRIPQS
uniref:Retrovirus-related Pol polyprotein from transposon TNT 1-94 n=1 Tax=Tanacetum cinerariifolium TaxID=118510 RepID=A0A699H2M8_TANCI|nr:hypothetical protein [Tanacetum cinerariifolium]